MKKFPDEESARIYFENKRWKGTPVCPQCGSSTNQYKQYRIDKKTGLKKAGYYLCYHCKLVYTVRTGTIFERSHIPLNVWFLAIYKIVTARKGISSLQLSKEIGVRQGTAWFMQHRIREACSNNSPLLKGEIEADEAYFGGKEGNKHASKKLNAGRGTVGKIAVLGIRERDGRLHAKVIYNGILMNMLFALTKAM